jgi:hypothetical protein
MEDLEKVIADILINCVEGNDKNRTRSTLASWQTSSKGV